MNYLIINPQSQGVPQIPSKIYIYINKYATEYITRKLQKTKKTKRKSYNAKEKRQTSNG